MKTKSYSFTGDFGHAELRAQNEDQAARLFEQRVESMAGLLERCKRLGGYVTVRCEGEIIHRISSEAEGVARNF